MSQEPNNNEIDVRRILITCLRHWYWFGIGVVLCCALGALYYFRTTPKFQTQGSIMLRQKSDSKLLGSFSGALSMFGVEMNGVASDEVEVLTSRDLMYQTIDALDLWQTHRCKKGLRWLGEFPATTFRLDTVQLTKDAREKGFGVKIAQTRRGGYKITVKSGFLTRSTTRVDDLSGPIETCVGTILLSQNKVWNEEVSAYSISYPGVKAAIVDSYQKKVTISLRKKESNIIDISTVSDMPVRDEALLAKMIELYNLNTIVDKNIIATSTAAFIDERLRIIETELSDAETAVEEYKSKNSLTDIEEEARLVLKTNVEEQKELSRVETQLNLVGYIEEFLQDETKRFSMLPANLGIEDNSLNSFISEYNTLMLKRMQLLRTATDQNPVLEKMNDQLTSMRQNIIASIGSVRESLLITRDGLLERDAEFVSRIKGAPSQERQYVQIKRQQMLKEEVYLYLYQKREENALMLATTTTPVRMLDVPKMNTLTKKPSLKMVLFLCLVLGLGLPAVLLYLKELFDNKLHDAKDFEKSVHAPFAGQIVENSRGAHIAIHEGENTVSAELFRQLRTNLRFMLPADIKSPVIMVTSSINGEGKSYIATNTALSLAILGKKVILVGLDIRKPMLAQYFNLSAKGCLTSYLSDTTFTVDDTIVPSGEHKNLDIIPCGVIPPNPNELLQDERLDALFAELRKRYDYIIVDTAPMAMVSDTFLLDRISDVTLFVSRSDYTPREMVGFINNLVADKKMKKIICVLNGVKNMQGGYGYGYGTQK